MLDGPPSQSDCDHWRAGCGESSHAPFGNRPTEKDPNQGHLAGGRVHSAGGHGKRTRGNPDTAPVPDLTAATRLRSCRTSEVADHR
jgi:hypothetical protein